MRLAFYSTESYVMYMWSEAGILFDRMYMGKDIEAGILFNRLEHDVYGLGKSG